MRKQRASQSVLVYVTQLVPCTDMFSVVVLLASGDESCLAGGRGGGALGR